MPVCAMHQTRPSDLTFWVSWDLYKNKNNCHIYIWGHYSWKKAQWILKLPPWWPHRMQGTGVREQGLPEMECLKGNSYMKTGSQGPAPSFYEWARMTQGLHKAQKDDFPVQTSGLAREKCLSWEFLENSLPRIHLVSSRFAVWFWAVSMIWKHFI